MDREITVESNDAKQMADRLCREEGLFCGISSGANVVAAIEMAKRLGPGSTVVTVIVDRRDRYFAEHPNEHYVGLGGKDRERSSDRDMEAGRRADPRSHAVCDE